MIYLNVAGPTWAYLGAMAAFLYRCPNTGLNVQGWVADDPTADDSFRAVICTACTRAHLVNPKTGKVIVPTEQ